MKYELNPKILERLKKVKKVIKEIENWYLENPYKNWQYWSLTRFLAYQGVRISEALLLTWENVNLEEKIALIRQLKKRKEIVREIPLHQKVVEAFEKCPFEKKGRIWNISRIAAFMFYKKYGINPHILRHNFGITLLKKGIDLETIRRALGHSGYGYLKMYLDLSLEDIREKIEQISLF
jgi:integrase